MFRPFAAVVASVWVTVPGPAVAQDVDRLFDALRLGDVVAVMREEGVAAGDDLADDLFPDSGRQLWDREVAQIYDAATMTAAVRTEFENAIPPEQVSPLLEFFESDTGRRFVDLEIAARRSMMDEAVEVAAEAAAEDTDPDRRELIEAFIDANDLVEQNVTGALNSNFAFYSGLLDGGAPIGDLTEDQVIRDVWSSEPQVREDTIGWLEGYLTMAYAPMTDRDLERYIEVSRSDAGQDLNAAIFRAFDGLYNDISYDLGRAAARFMQGEDI